MPQYIGSGGAARAAVFAPLEGAGRAELVSQRLTDAIVLGVLGNGERLPSEADLAKQFGVATVTAREALETLRDNRLVVTRRGRDGGSFVTFTDQDYPALLAERLRALSRVEIRDIGVHYSAIASMAAELAADRSTPADAENLRRLLATIDRAHEGSCRRGQLTFSLDVAALSQSARLVREELRMQAEFGSFIWLGLREQPNRDRAADRRKQIVAAIESVDSDAARRATAILIDEAIEALIDAKTELELERDS
ncbi:FadR/GntR family transcriptional regulator [Glaciibacter psychrotolerans]|uniref:DNA-binding FadR family transcriptional regulator n=1 Tax=Glaciibacter psychrotolerans TaxID=670054 RepID=A0A7Z0J5E9_9MICO|nr:GntR family transcriptional regulator [Leifsonia psychrotolerans]NYJ19402.1 DNA-binding FadR family transcriptional regulator [Leifsonia psychrotolerans]